MKKIISILLIIITLLSIIGTLSSCGNPDHTHQLTSHKWKRAFDNDDVEIIVEFTPKGDGYSGDYDKTVTDNGKEVAIDEPWDSWTVKNNTKLTLWPVESSKEYVFAELNEKDLKKNINRAMDNEWYVSDNYLVIGYEIYQPAD